MGENGAKKVFISDLHMGDGRALHGTDSGFPYGWLRANIPLAAKFLEEQLRSDDVEEVVVLGDLFDGWVIPSDIDPALPSSSSPFYERICKTDDNQRIVAALQELAGRKTLSYVAGNHDMLVTKEFMEEAFLGIKFVEGSVEYPMWRRYEDGQLVAEHGHMYDPFCGTDDWTLRLPSMPQYLPLGYYFSRVVAHKVAATGEHQDVLDICAKFGGEALKGHVDIPEDAFLAAAEDSGLDKYSQINLGNGAPSVYVSDVGKAYSEILQYWGRHTPTQAKALEVVFRGLAECIYEQYFRPDNGFRIAICGHTHVPILRSWYSSRNKVVTWVEHLLKKSPSVPASYVYANSGTWIDFGHPCTYVETEKDFRNNRHYVRLKSYSKDGYSRTTGEVFVPLDESGT
jgi:UDP-2,3-diacylglucosamine pyrophosphatase LpxH